MTRAKGVTSETVTEAEEPTSTATSTATATATRTATIDSLLERVGHPQAEAKVEAVPVLRTARVVALGGPVVKIAWRGRQEAVAAVLAPGLERELIERAAKDKETVLVEVAPGEKPLVVGVLATKVPRELNLKGTTVTIEAEREVLIRAGRAALRIREDGDVEVIGGRIVAASRGLLRLAGRILRLN